jgi:CHAT domain-containing protein/tetratricopeptide (TPR) repeat protein
MRVSLITLALGGCLILSAQPEVKHPLTPVAERLDAAPTLEARTALLSQPTAELLDLCLTRARAFAAKFDQDAALRSYQSVVAVAVALHEPVKASSAWRGIGLMRNRQGRFTEAIDSYRSGLALLPDSELKPRGDLLRSTGVSLRALSNFTEALVVDEQALALFREAKDDDGIFITLSGMGGSYSRLGDLHKAVDLFQQSMKLAEKIGRKDGIYKSIENLANVYTLQGDNALALASIDRALSLKLRDGATKAELADSYVNQIDTYRGLERYDDALHAAGRALELARETGQDIERAYVLINRAKVYRDLKRYPEALADLASSLAISERSKAGLEIASTLTLIAELELKLGRVAAGIEHAGRAAGLARGLPDTLWPALAVEGEGYVLTRQPAKARAAFAEGIALVDALRKQLAGGEQEGQEYLRDKISLFHGLMVLEVEARETGQALRVAEKAKAGLILDTLRAGHAGITHSMTAEERKREQQLAAGLSAARAERGRDAGAFNRAAREWESFRSELYAAHPELKVRRGEAEPLTLAAAGALLPDDSTALIEFAVSPNATYLFTIARNAAGQPDLRVYPIAITEAALAGAVDAFRNDLAARGLGYRDQAISLYTRLLAPAAATLRGKRLLAIVPDGPLWGLPFQALIGTDGRHLIEQSAVFYAPSLTVLLETSRSRRTPAPAGGAALLAMGDPETSLPNSAREVTALAALYGEGSRAFTGAQATEAAWKKLAPDYRVLHLATHGNLNRANPLYSSVVLAPGGGEDGLLEGREILDLDLHADLTVLSACETGRGGFRYGEGLVGLSWALMVAGSPTSLVSQWKVDSASTTSLMVGFHRALLPKLSGKAAAWRSATLALLKDNATRHPYYWAAFALIGDGY